MASSSGAWVARWIRRCRHAGVWFCARSTRRFPHIVSTAPLVYTPSALNFVPGVCRMEEAPLVADRAHLRKLLRTHPTWPYQEYADQIGRSYDWVKKWAKRLLAAPPDDESVLWSRSSARKHLSPPLDPAVIERILAIRDDPPEHLQRTPGPKAI